MPFPIRHIAPVIAQRQMRQTLHLHGLGRHTHEEQLGFARRDLAAIPELIASGEITHALVIVAFFGLDRWMRAEKGRGLGEGWA